MKLVKKETLAALAVVGVVGGFALAAPTMASASDTSSRHGSHAEPGDDHGRHHGGRHHGEAEPGDDRGGRHHDEAEPGDDHGRHHGGRHHHGEVEPGDDHGHHGSDD